MDNSTDNRMTELKLALIKAAEEIGSNEMFATQVYRYVAVKNGYTWDGTNIGRLAGIPVSSIDELSSFRESELRRLYGIGDKSIAVIRLALRESGYDFAPEILERCPFCGGEAHIKHDHRWPDDAYNAVDAYEVVCLNFDCIIYDADDVWYKTEAEAIAAWNTRAERTCTNVEKTFPKDEFDCSECGYEGSYELGIPYYCPQCGARVIGVDE